MDVRMEQSRHQESGVTRRVITRSAAAGGLAALFASVGAGRVLADENDEDVDTADYTVDTADEIDTVDTVDTADTVDTVDDDQAGAGLTGGARVKGKKAHKSGKRRKGRH